MGPAPMIAAVLCVWAFTLTCDAPAGAAELVPNSADRLIMWAGCGELVTMSDAELDLWKSRGVDGFVCMGKRLWGMGGDQRFTGDPGASLESARYELQRRLRDSGIVARAKGRGMKMYLGAKLVNYYNPATPLRDWFDDDGWSERVLPSMGDLAAAARQLGFAGLAFDQELYPQRDGVSTATWDWNYPGNQRGEVEVRAKARQRGKELMTRILSAFPGTELLAYDVKLPETWGELVQKEVNGIQNAYSRRLDIDIWDGLSSVEGYGAIRLVDHTFYKSPHLGNWDRALHYHYNRLYSYLSRHLSNWSYASSRLHVSPFSWMDPGPKASAFDDARPVGYVAQQLQAFRKWGTGGEFANYAYRGLRTFDYSPYASAMVAASAPAVVDAQAPALTVGEAGTAPTKATGTTLSGTTGDNLAIRAVRWVSDYGHEGMAELSWQIVSGDPRSGYTGKMRWSIPELRLEPGDNRITITAEDIKGLTTSSTLTIHRMGPTQRAPGPLPAPPPRTEQSPTGQRNAHKTKRGAKRRAASKRHARVRARRRCLRRARSRHSPAARRAARRCAKRARRSS